MSIVISSALVLSATEENDPRNPRIGYHNLITANNIAADEETDDEPAVNIANPSTYLKWRGTTTGDQSITVTLGTAADVNYFAIAKHNLGSTGATVKLQSSDDGSSWTDASDAVEPSTDYALICEFETVFAKYFRLYIEPGDEPPSIAVMYLGEILPLQRTIYVGHSPITLSRSTTVSTGRAEAGQFLGRHLRREFIETSVDLQNLTPTWYRQKFDPFVEHARTKPFFFAWYPTKYPSEVGYAWLKGDIRPTNQRANGMMQVSFSMEAIR